MKVFISQPMNGKSDEEILNAKKSALFKIEDFAKRTMNSEIEVVDTFFKNYDGNRLQFLGKSIVEGLALADLAVFLPGWEKADGCRCEHYIAMQYGVTILYINE